MAQLTIPKTWSTNESPLKSADLNSNFNAVATLINTTGLDATSLQAGIITNTQVSSTAAIALSKLAAGSAAGQLLVTGAASTYTPAYQTITGDITITSGGVTAIGSGKVTSANIVDGTIVNADVSSSAAIAYSKLSLGASILNADVSATAAIAVSKLAAGTSAQVLMNNATPTPTYTTLSGDVTVGATGVTAIGAAKVTSAMMANGVVKNRQGGTSGDAAWAPTTGTTNTDTSAKAAFIQVGMSHTTSSTTPTVTFPTAYNYAPVVMGAVYGSPATTNTSFQVQSVSATNFTYNCQDKNGSRVDTDVMWVSVGQ